MFPQLTIPRRKPLKTFESGACPSPLSFRWSALDVNREIPFSSPRMYITFFLQGYSPLSGGNPSFFPPAHTCEIYIFDLFLALPTCIALPFSFTPPFWCNRIVRYRYLLPLLIVTHRVFSATLGTSRTSSLYSPPQQRIDFPPTAGFF